MTKKYFVARAIIGHEFAYVADSAHFVSVANRDRICAALNRAGYQLKPGQTWRVFEYEGGSICHEWRINHGSLYEYDVLSWKY